MNFPRQLLTSRVIGGGGGGGGEEGWRRGRLGGGGGGGVDPRSKPRVLGLSRIPVFCPFPKRAEQINGTTREYCRHLRSHWPSGVVRRVFIKKEYYNHKKKREGRQNERERGGGGRLERKRGDGVKNI